MSDGALGAVPVPVGYNPSALRSKVNSSAAVVKKTNSSNSVNLSDQLSQLINSFTPSVSNAAGVSNSFDSVSLMREIADRNNQLSADQARIQREWQEKQNAKAMAFNRSEAEKNRNWQQMMSNTAHQREIEDLKAAGLNPVLSALNGNGAAVTSGATASGVSSSGAKGEVDTSLNSSIVNLLGTVLDNQTKLQMQNMSAINNLAVADKYTEMNKIVAQIAASSQQLINSANLDQQRYFKENYPSSLYEAIPTVLRYTVGSPTEIVSSAYDKLRSSNVLGKIGDSLTNFKNSIAKTFKKYYDVIKPK